MSNLSKLIPFITSMPFVFICNIVYLLTNLRTYFILLSGLATLCYSLIYFQKLMENCCLFYFIFKFINVVLPCNSKHILFHIVSLF